MEVSFGNDALDSLESDPDADTDLDHKLVRAFRKVMAFVRASRDERDIYAHPGLNFEKLKGDLKGLHSLRLNDQWRLVVEIRNGHPKNIIHVKDIQDYH